MEKAKIKGMRNVNQTFGQTYVEDTHFLKSI